MNLPHTHTHTDVIKHTAGVRLQVTAERGRNDEKKKKTKRLGALKSASLSVQKTTQGLNRKRNVVEQ